MPVVACTCGKKLRARDDLAGKKVKCPGCGRLLTVPPVAREVRPEKVASRPPPLPASEEREAPAANARPAPVQAALFWRSPHNFSERLLVLTRDGFYWAHLKAKKLERAEEALEEGEAPEDVLGDEMVFVPLRKVTLISANKHHASMTVRFLGVDEHGKDAAQSDDFEFPTAKERDKAFKTLRVWLEPPWEYQREDFTAARAAVAPVVTILIIAVITLGLAWLAQVMRGWTGSARVPAWAAFLYHTMVFLGPAGVSLVGAVIVSLCMIWLFVRARKPPIMLNLKPPPPDEDAVDDDPEEDD